MFQYPLNLHCSQTRHLSIYSDRLFQYPLNLHCSQTSIGSVSKLYRFQYPLNLHCSQTMYDDFTFLKSFNTLWIYTALKQSHIIKNIIVVSIPSEFTLLSNKSSFIIFRVSVSIPSEFTLLSNTQIQGDYTLLVSIPSEFTLLSNKSPFKILRASVSIPSEFTLLSNQHKLKRFFQQFQYPLNLHCSQTIFGICFSK